MRRNRDGQALVEYALILVLVAVTVIAILVIAGVDLLRLYDEIARRIPG